MFRTISSIHLNLLLPCTLSRCRRWLQLKRCHVQHRIRSYRFLYPSDVVFWRCEFLDFLPCLDVIRYIWIRKDIGSVGARVGEISSMLHCLCRSRPDVRCACVQEQICGWGECISVNRQRKRKVNKQRRSTHKGCDESSDPGRDSD